MFVPGGKVVSITRKAKTRFQLCNVYTIMTVTRDFIPQNFMFTKYVITSAVG